MSGATLIAEVGFTDPTTGAALFLDDEVRGLLDTGELAADDVYIDVSAYVSSLTLRCGVDRVDGPIVTYGPGTGTLVLRNEDGRFDPENTTGPYASGGISQVAPMARVRISAAHNGVTYVLATMYADDWQVTDEQNRSTVVVPLFDALSVFAGIDRTASAGAGGGELAGARIGRILDSLGWPDEDRLIDTGQTAMVATTLDGDGLTELQECAEAELGEFFIDPEGHAVFRERYAILTDARSAVSQATFGDDLAGGELPYSSVTRDKSRSSVYNRVAITPEGGDEQTVEDLTSSGQYLVRTWARTLPMSGNAAALDYANVLLAQTAQPEMRFSEMVLRPDRDADNVFPHALGRRLGDRITIKCRPPAGGYTLERDVFIRGITREVRPARGDDGADWTVTFALQSATRFAYLVLDDAVYGVLDSNALMY